MRQFKPGDRIVNRKGERGTVVARNASTPADATPVVYDADDAVTTVWNSATYWLQPLEED